MQVACAYPGSVKHDGLMYFVYALLFQWRVVFMMVSETPSIANWVARPMRRECVV